MSQKRAVRHLCPHRRCANLKSIAVMHYKISEAKLYCKILIFLTLVTVLSTTPSCMKADNEVSLLISRLEISLLQCRRAEKNFLLRHDQTSTDHFAQEIQDLRKHEADVRLVTRDKAVLGLLDDIKEEIVIYEKTFQDIKGLYDSKSFGPVSDPALLKITDEVTLMAKPAETPSSVETTMSLIEAARNLEYYIKIFPKKPAALASILQARRWEKNFQQRYDKLTGDPGARSIFYMSKVKQETANIREWLRSEEMKGSLDAEFVKLRSALDRYEYNLGQLVCNVDAFYVKKKEMLKSARKLDRSVQMIKEKVFGTGEETDIDGIYYLSPRLPVHGQPEGNHHDVGSLLSSRPSSYGYRHCKNWMQFYFDRDGLYTEEKIISSIYFHVWIRTVNNSIEVGYEKDGKYSGGSGAVDDFIEVAYDASKGYSTRNGCSLITGKIDMNCSVSGEDIYKFALKLSRHSGYPSVVMEPNQYSFIIINPPSDSILKSTDRDGDGLNDHEEMFVYHTNPYDEDTDGDGFSDKTEVLKGISPNINDLYSGEVIDGINDTPHIDNYKEIDGDWIVDKKERHINSKFTLHGNLVIRNGGSLTLDNCILDMNRKAKSKQIRVDKGGSLSLTKTNIDFNETGYWYKVVEGSNVEVGSNFEIHGTVNIHKSILQNSLGIKVCKRSKTKICDSHILNCYHLSYEGESDSTVEHSVISTFIGVSIYCKSSSPIISYTLLSTEYSGIGIYCFGSSPHIDNSKILVCEDEDSDSSAFVLVENSHPALLNTIFNTKRIRCDETSAIIFK